MMKKLLTMGLIGALLLATGCGNGTPSVTKSSDEAVTTAVTTASLIPSEPMEMKDMTAMELTANMKIGWNLGNTMDATGGDGLSAETSWGNPKTTKEMIDMVKAAGFDTLRLPVTWSKHYGPAPEYTIDAAWLDRVEEIANYALANDMYVIINMHHESWNFPSSENEGKATEILVALWKQVAKRFENYDEHVIFEGLNEPRKSGTKVEWTGGDKEAWDVINNWNAAFVKTIREAGGNNPLRIVMIPAYAASSDKRIMETLKIPENDNKIIVSVHSYSPYNFALNEKGTSTFDPAKAADTKDIDGLVKSIDDVFKSKGIPVIVGECGARSKDNLDERLEWAEYFSSALSKADIPFVLWDNNGLKGKGELFGLLNRKTMAWEFPTLVETLVNGTK